MIALEDEMIAHAAVIERRLEINGQGFRTGHVKGTATARARASGGGFRDLVHTQRSTPPQRPNRT